MSTRPYELLARFAADGTVAGVSVRTITTVNGRDFESDPQPLADAADPAFTQFAEAFSAAIVAERDALNKKIESLQARLDAARIPHDLRMIDPRAWYSRFTRNEIIAIARRGATDAIVQSIIDNLDASIAIRESDATYQMSLDHINAIRGVGYLQSIGILSADRVVVLLDDSKPDEV